VIPREFLDELFGPGWREEDLPLYLDKIKETFEDAQRYYVVRDFAKNIKLTDNLASNEERKRTDDIVDARRFAHDFDEN
jgi:hypothetical protein